MTTTSEIFELAQAALEWDVARRVALQLKHLRGACRCEIEEPDEPEVGANGAPPCWKNWQSGIEDVTLPPQSEWCATCRRRQRLHEAYRASMKKRGARRRTLQRFALKGIDLRTIEREVRTAMADDQDGKGTENPDAPETSTADGSNGEAAGEGESKPEAAGD